MATQLPHRLGELAFSGFRLDWVPTYGRAESLISLQRPLRISYGNPLGVKDSERIAYLLSVKLTPEGVWMTPTGKPFRISQGTSSASLAEVACHSNTPAREGDQTLTRRLRVDREMQARDTSTDANIGATVTICN
jgi:hypothetical protein